MCGIFLFSRKYEDKTKETFDLLKHRGPDANNFFKDNSIIIGHNLLQIRGNLEESIQPLISSCNRYVLAFNGQIYNSEEIDKKYNFFNQSNLDTKTIINLISLKGVKFIQEIEGMFAIVVYDRLKKIIHFFRDYSGQKNLYYYLRNGEIIICSEIQPIFNLIEKININNNLLCENLIVGYSLSSETIYSNINKLLPGEEIQFDLENKSINKNFYKKKNINNSLKAEELLEKYVNNHLITKKKIAINLSGGLDSNLILYETLKKNLKIDVFSTKFIDAANNYNEDYEMAKSIAKIYNLNFYSTEIEKKEYIDKFIKTFSIIEEPNRNINNPVYFINYENQKRNGFRTIISGDGGDEVFIGYPYYFKEKFSNLYNSNKLTKVYDWINSFKRYNSLNNNFTSLNYHNIKIKFLSTLIKTEKIFSNYVKNFYSNLILKRNFHLPLLDQIFWLPGEIFLRSDKLSMWNSIETRAPLCDFNIRKYFIRDWKIDSFKKSINKKVVRKIYENKLHNSIINNTKKTGWTVPQEWLSDKKLKDNLLDIIPKKDHEVVLWSKVRDYIDKKNSIKDKFLHPLISVAILFNKNKIQ
jgi:asparagine synthase (glutamine-hydrolysing)